MYQKIVGALSILVHSLHADLKRRQFETKTNGRCRRSLARVQSGFRPALRTTLPHLSFSAATNWPNSPGVPTTGWPPSSASRTLELASASTALVSRLSLSMISVGVLLGAPTPCQPPA